MRAGPWLAKKQYAYFFHLIKLNLVLGMMIMKEMQELLNMFERCFQVYTPRRYGPDGRDLPWIQ